MVRGPTRLTHRFDLRKTIQVSRKEMCHIGQARLRHALIRLAGTMEMACLVVMDYRTASSDLFIDYVAEIDLPAVLIEVGAAFWWFATGASAGAPHLAYLS